MLVLVQLPRTRPVARMVALLSSVLTLSLAASPLVAQAPASSAPLADGARATPRAANTLKQLDPADLAFWKSIRYASVSPDGKWFAYQLTPNEGDAEVVVRPTGEGPERRFAIGEPPPPTGGFGGGGVNTSVVLSEDGKWVAFTKYPTAAEAKRLRKDRKPVQSGVVVVDLRTGERRDIPRLEMEQHLKSRQKKTEKIAS